MTVSVRSWACTTVPLALARFQVPAVQPNASNSSAVPGCRFSDITLPSIVKVLRPRGDAKSIGPSSSVTLTSPGHHARADMSSAAVSIAMPACGSARVRSVSPARSVPGKPPPVMPDVSACQPSAVRVSSHAAMLARIPIDAVIHHAHHAAVTSTVIQTSLRMLLPLLLVGRIGSIARNMEGNSKNDDVGVRIW